MAILVGCEVASHCGFAHPLLLPQIPASFSSKDLEHQFSPTTSQHCLNNKSVKWYVYTSQYLFRPYRYLLNIMVILEMVTQGSSNFS